MQRNHTKQLARKIMSLLLAGVFFADTAIFAEAPILPDERANSYTLSKTELAGYV